MEDDLSQEDIELYSRLAFEVTKANVAHFLSLLTEGADGVFSLTAGSVEYLRGINDYESLTTEERETLARPIRRWWDIKKQVSY